MKWLLFVVKILWKLISWCYSKRKGGSRRSFPIFPPSLLPFSPPPWQLQHTTPYISFFSPTAMTTATHYPLYLFLFPHRHDSCKTLPPISLSFPRPSWQLKHTTPYISSFFPTAMSAATHYPLYLFFFPTAMTAATHSPPPISLPFSPPPWQLQHTTPYISSFFPTVMTAATHYPLYLFLFPHRHETCNTLSPISLPVSPPSWQLHHTTPYISSFFPTVMKPATHYPLYLFLFPHRHETCNTLPPISLPFSPPPWQLQHTTPYISSPNQSSFFPSKSCSYFLVRSEPH